MLQWPGHFSTPYKYHRANGEKQGGGPLYILGTLYGDLCKNAWTDRDAVWVVNVDGPKEYVLDKVQITLLEAAVFLREKGLSL